MRFPGLRTVVLVQTKGIKELRSVSHHGEIYGVILSMAEALIQN